MTDAQSDDAEMGAIKAAMMPHIDAALAAHARAGCPAAIDEQRRPEATPFPSRTQLATWLREYADDAVSFDAKDAEMLWDAANALDEHDEHGQRRESPLKTSEAGVEAVPVVTSLADRGSEESAPNADWTCPQGHRDIVRLHDEIMHDVKDAIGCASCGCAYCLVNGRWFQSPWKPAALPNASRAAKEKP